MQRQCGWQYLMTDAVQEPEPLPPLPPNSAVLVVTPAKDRVHTFMRLTYDITHLSEDKQKLLLFRLTQALTELEKYVKDMGKIEAAAQLGKLERLKATKSNGEHKS